MTTNDDFLTQLGVNDNLRLIVQRSAKEFEDTGKFVSFETLAHEAAVRDEPIDMNEVFKMPQVLGGAWTAEKVDLTGLGLVEAGTAPITSAMMARLAGICGQRKLTLKEGAIISGQLLVDEYGFSVEDAARAVELIQKLPGVSGGGSLGDEWSLSVFRTALDYRKVRSVDDLRAILEAQAIERMQLNNQSMAAFSSLMGDEGGVDEGACEEPSPPVSLVLNVQELKVLERVVWEVRRAEEDSGLDGIDPGVQAEVERGDEDVGGAAALAETQAVNRKGSLEVARFDLS